MARIPADHIDRIKQEISLLRLAESQGHKLVKQGKDYAVCCPFHDDKTPSCIISPKSNLFNCFGCGKGGTVIDWVMETQKISFRHAVEILRDEHFPSLVADTSTVSLKTPASVPKLETPITQNVEDQKVLQDVIEFYHQTLLASPEAQAYLAKRGLDDAELVKHFKLGYANRTLGLRLPLKNRKAGAAMREQLQRIGLYRETGREHFNGSLVIPVMDEQGVVTEVYGRKTIERLRKGTPKHTYLPGPHQGIFNPHALQHGDELIVCESLIDALTFWRWGFKHVTCAYGVNGFTEELLQGIISHNIKRVVLAFDRDEAGERGAQSIAEQLQASGIDCYKALFPKGMDANEYALKMSPPQKSLALVLRKAEWLGIGKAPKSIVQNEEVTEVENSSPLAAKTVEQNNQEVSKTTEGDNTEPTKNTEKNSAIDAQATPAPSTPFTGVEVEVKGHEWFITLGTRCYRVRGFDRNNAHYDQLKIQLMVRQDEAMHMDKLDLYSSKQRQVFINQASLELGLKDEIIKKDLVKVLLVLEEQQQQQDQEEQVNALANEISHEDKQAAMALLQDPDVLGRVLEDFKRAGVVGEDTNKLVAYLACVSRKLDKPLAVMIQSSSAAGKSSLMDSVLAFMPDEERTQYSAMTGQSLFYMGETSLKHKILAISEEEGASNASYALKLLQSEGEVTIASTGKDDNTGNLITKEYKVEGPVMLLMTTTAIDIDEELMNRCLVLSVNESREQTEAIHAAQRQRRTLEGLKNKASKAQMVELHKNAQRLLKPLAVINPYADKLTFLSDKTRTRRDHEKYLTLIDSIALLHQHQRELKSAEIPGGQVSYIEATLDDIAMANQLAHEVLGRTLDELPPQTRKLLKGIQAMVREACKVGGIEQSDFRFSRKQVRDYIQWSDSQLKTHCKRLEEMEYLLVHRGGRGQSFEYELLYDAQDDEQQHLMGLIDIEALKKQRYDAKQSGLNTKKSASSLGQVCPKSGSLNGAEATPAMALRESGLGKPECTSGAV